MKIIFIKYFPSYETRNTIFSISIGTLNLLTRYFRIVNSGLLGKIIHADYFLSTDSMRMSMCDLVSSIFLARVLGCA